MKLNKEDLKNLKPEKRTTKILEIRVLELLKPEKEGVELNEGYEYEINGSIPQLADGIAKMLIQMDKDKDFGKKGGNAFLTLITEYYNKNK